MMNYYKVPAIQSRHPCYAERMNLNFIQLCQSGSTFPTPLLAVAGSEFSVDLSPELIGETAYFVLSNL